MTLEDKVRAVVEGATAPIDEWVALYGDAKVAARWRARMIEEYTKIHTECLARFANLLTHGPEEPNND